MLIYMQSGTCNECGGELTRIESPIPNQDPVEAFLCVKCSQFPEISDDIAKESASEDDSWMFEEYPDKYSMWELCVKEFKKVKRRADLWNDLKHVLKNGKWSDPNTIEAVLTNMDYMESVIEAERDNASNG